MRAYFKSFELHLNFQTNKDDEVSVDIESKLENEDEKACLRFRKNGQFAIFEMRRTPGSPPRFSASGSQANEDDLLKIAEDCFHLVSQVDLR